MSIELLLIAGLYCIKVCIGNEFIDLLEYSG